MYIFLGSLALSFAPSAQTWWWFTSKNRSNRSYQGSFRNLGIWVSLGQLDMGSIILATKNIYARRKIFTRNFLCENVYILKYFVFACCLGEKHGTITARINDTVNFEVTTLRIDKVGFLPTRNSNGSSIRVCAVLVDAERATE
jgi:hypothetical protein